MIIGSLIGLWFVCAIMSLGRPTASNKTIAMLIIKAVCFYGLIGFVLDIIIHFILYIFVIKLNI